MIDRMMHLAFVGLILAGMSGCGSSRVSTVNLTPNVADAQNFSGGQVQFAANGTYSGSSKVVPLRNLTWCIGTSTGLCNGNIAAAATVDANGLASCVANSAGTVTVLAGTGGKVTNPDGGRQLSVFGSAQLTCP